MPAIKTILDEHFKYSPQKYYIRSNLGDGYLLAKNRIFRNVRSATAKNYRFTQKLFKGESSFKLSFLNEYHLHKRIPYLDNVTRLVQISKINNSISLSAEFRMFEKNYLLHESAHGMARLMLPKVSNKSFKRKFMSALLEESFANTAEVCSFIFSDSPLHSYFLRHNSYSEGKMHVLKNKTMIKNQKFLNLYFCTVFMSFMYANYLFEKPTISIFKRSLKVSRAILDEDSFHSPKEILELERGFLLGFQLDPTFRLVTTELYAKISGYKTPLSGLTSFDFLHEIAKDKELQSQIRNLILETMKS